MAHATKHISDSSRKTCEGCGRKVGKSVKGFCPDCGKASKRIKKQVHNRRTKGRSYLPPMLSLNSVQCRPMAECNVCGIAYKPKTHDRTTCCGVKCGHIWTGFKYSARKSGGRVYVTSIRNKAAQPIRADYPPAPSHCLGCGAGYYRAAPYQRYCTEQCGETAKLESARRSRRIGKLVRKAKIRTSGPVERIDPIKVFERDSWRCGICGMKTHRAKRGTYHPNAPELDHIVAIANGGTHTWDNVQCACRECNGRKGASNFGQMLLFPAA